MKKFRLTMLVVFGAATQNISGSDARVMQKLDTILKQTNALNTAVNMLLTRMEMAENPQDKINAISVTLASLPPFPPQKIVDKNFPLSEVFSNSSQSMQLPKCIENDLEEVLLLVLSNWGTVINHSNIDKLYTACRNNVILAHRNKHSWQVQESINAHKTLDQLQYTYSSEEEIACSTLIALNKIKEAYSMLYAIPQRYDNINVFLDRYEYSSDSPEKKALLDRIPKLKERISVHIDLCNFLIHHASIKGFGSELKTSLSTLSTSIKRMVESERLLASEQPLKRARVSALS